MGLAKPNRHGDRDRPPRAKGKGSGLNGTPTANGVLHFEFPSDFEIGCDVQQRILQEVERQGFNSNSLFATRLALEAGSGN